MKFTTREIICLMVALALGPGWLCDRAILAARVAGLTDQIRLVEHALAEARAK
jgi:hypothetical protein